MVVMTIVEVNPHAVQFVDINQPFFNEGKVEPKLVPHSLLIVSKFS